MGDWGWAKLITFVGALALSSSTWAAQGQSPVWPELRSAVLIRVEREEGPALCSGVAVSPQKVFTAAHCLEGVFVVSVFYGTEPALEPTALIPATAWALHPKYDSYVSNFAYDLGSIVLRDPLPPEVVPAVIAGPGDLPAPGTRLERVGFGDRGKGNLRTWTNPELLGTESPGAIAYRDAHAVHGDSGGPVFVRTPQGLRLLGIHSTLEGEDHAIAVLLSVVTE